MVDSTIVLNGQAIAYTIYAIAIILLVGWFGYKVTSNGEANGLKPKFFYMIVGVLIVLGVSLHIATNMTIPWVETDLNRADIKPDKVFEINVKKHEFILPSEKIEVKLKEKVLFNVTSSDLTYGFGVFRTNNSMVFQMQVVPGHKNDILWEFEKAGVYTIRSTEYSGPKGHQMILKDVIVVSE
jgi:cytochrome c oxidase subunit 2